MSLQVSTAAQTHTLVDSADSADSASCPKLAGQPGQLGARALARARASLLDCQRRRADFSGAKAEGQRQKEKPAHTEERVHHFARLLGGGGAFILRRTKRQQSERNGCARERAKALERPADRPTDSCRRCRWLRPNSTSHSRADSSRLGQSNLPLVRSLVSADFVGGKHDGPMANRCK